MNLNPQIVQAVEKVREMVMANPDRNANALVQPLIAQALGMAVQNAVPGAGAEGLGVGDPGPA